jgi:DNA-binding transcriptional regulator YiaG
VRSLILYKTSLVQLRLMSSRTFGRRKKEEALDMKAIGRRIRELRGFDLNQQTFSRLLATSQSELSKFERGERKPSLELLLRIKAKFGKTVDWILTGKE